MISVLIIDDEGPIRNSLAEFLRDYDFEVETADSAEAGLSLLEEACFDIAIVDLRLPGMSGERFILKAVELDPKMRYLIHTGSVDYLLSEELMALGITGRHLLSKPVVDLWQVSSV